MMKSNFLKTALMILCSLTLLLSICGGSDGDNKYTGVSMRQYFQLMRLIL